MATDDKKSNDGPGKMKFYTEVLELGITAITAFMLITGNKHVQAAETKEEQKKVAMEHFPKWFGIHSDEGIWSSIRSGLQKPFRIGVDKVLSKLTISERDAFAKNLDEAPRAITTDAQGNDSSVREFGEKDPRVIYLRNLVSDANMCKTPNDVRMAVNSLRVNRMLEESRFSKIEKGGMSAAAKFIGVARIEDLSEPAKLVDAIEITRMKVRAKGKKVYNPNWFLRGLLGE